MDDIIKMIEEKDPGEREFHQAVEEVLESVKPVLDRNPEYRRAAVLGGLSSLSALYCFGYLGWTMRGRSM